MDIEPHPPKAAFAGIVDSMRKKTESYRRPSKVTVPERCHPLARLVFAEMKRQGITYDQLEWDAGVLRSTFKAWRTNNLPSIPTISAALGVLGWDVAAIPQLDRMEPTLRADLEAVAAKHGLDALPHRELVASCIGYQHHTRKHIDARGRLKAGNANKEALRK